MAELEIIHDSIPSTEIVIDDGTGDVNFEPKVLDAPEHALSDGAGLLKRLYFTPTTGLMVL
ncbi:hypothetical protein [Pacificibacter sp. AS14]|uniref:hypothetical protein n=1 Tax=Pacificibacter sp. AS14 TaxID=3135785 RepID=UPI0031761BD6